MKKFNLIIFNLIIVCAYPTVENLSNHIDEDTNWHMIPQVDGTFKWMNTTEIETEMNMFSASRQSIIILYRLYTKKNFTENVEDIIMGDTSSLLKSNFNPKYPTRIILHGWQSNIEAPINKLICSAYLKIGNFNVISIDWSSIASSPNYIRVKVNVEEVGRKIAEFIDFMHDHGGMNLNDLYLIGHSLGAHASGFAGKYVTTGKINTIIGLDPANPLFPHDDENGRLSVYDAQYVETIHTNTGLWGVSYPIGNASFYPNGGQWQPGCPLIDVTCSHCRSYEFYAESINTDNRFVPLKCEKFDDLIYSKCSQEMEMFRMGGEPSNYGKADGVFYVITNSEKPYAAGTVLVKNSKIHNHPRNVL